MTDVISMPANLGTLIQQSLASAGLNFRGQVISRKIRRPPNDLTTGITHIDLCVRNLDTDQIMEASLLLYLSRLNSPSPSSKSSNPNTSEPSLPTFDGKPPLTNAYDETARLLASLDERDISLEDEMTLRLFVKQLHTTLNAALRTS